MFTFLRRLGRFAVGIPVVIAVTTIFGFGALNMVPAASKHKDPSCAVTPNTAAVNTTYVVSANGLPTLSPINLIVKYGNGTVTMSPLGSTPDGTFNLNESSTVSGTATYEFTGLIRNNNTQIYSRCSVTVS